MTLNIIFFDVKYNDKESAKMLGLKWNMKSKKWVKKTKKEIENNDDISILCKLFKIISIFSNGKFLNSDIVKVYNEKYIIDKLDREKYLYNHFGLNFLDDDDEEETTENFNIETVYDTENIN